MQEHQNLTLGRLIQANHPLSKTLKECLRVTPRDELLAVYDQLVKPANSERDTEVVRYSVRYLDERSGLRTKTSITLPKILFNDSVKTLGPVGFKEFVQACLTEIRNIEGSILSSSDRSMNASAFVKGRLISTLESLKSIPPRTIQPKPRSLALGVTEVQGSLFHA